MGVQEKKAPHLVGLWYPKSHQYVRVMAIPTKANGYLWKYILRVGGPLRDSADLNGCEGVWVAAGSPKGQSICPWVEAVSLKSQGV